MNRYLVVAALLLVGSGVSAGCSSPSESTATAPGGLVAGTAEVVIDGKAVATTQTVSCSTVAWFTTVDIGDAATGATAYVSSVDDLTARWVQVRNLDGFTGSYDEANGRKATMTMTGSTYEIDGMVRGIDVTRPNTTVTKPFTLKVAC